MRLLPHALGALPAGAGQYRIATRVARRYKPGDRAIGTLRGAARFDFDLSDRLQAIAMLERRYEPAVVRYIANALPQNGLFIDGGANVGLISFQVAALRPDVQVIAFEPLPANGDAWERNRELNPQVSAKLERVAIGDKPGMVPLLLGEERGWNRITTTIEGPKIEVPVCSLDDYTAEHGIGRIDVLKLDLENYEPAALRGAERLLSEGSIGAIVCEIDIPNDPSLVPFGEQVAEIPEYLASFGYRQQALPRVGLHRLLGHDYIESVFVRTAA